MGTEVTAEDDIQDVFAKWGLTLTPGRVENESSTEIGK